MKKVISVIMAAFLLVGALASVGGAEDSNTYANGVDIDAERRSEGRDKPYCLVDTDTVAHVCGTDSDAVASEKVYCYVEQVQKERDLIIGYDGAKPRYLTVLVTVAEYVEVPQSHFDKGEYTCLLYTSPSPRDS